MRTSGLRTAKFLVDLIGPAARSPFQRGPSLASRNGVNGGFVTVWFAFCFSLWTYLPGLSIQRTPFA